MPRLLRGCGSRASAGGGSSELGAGEFFASGDVSLAPNVGNFAPTTRFNDGSAGDTTTRETSSGGVFTIVHGHASSFSISSWAQTVKYAGNVTLAFSRWTGSAWAAITDTNGTGFPFGFAYADQSRTATFSGVTSSVYYRCVITEDNTELGNTSVSDSRPA